MEYLGRRIGLNVGVGLKTTFYLFIFMTLFHLVYRLHFYVSYDPKSELFLGLIVYGLFDKNMALFEI